LTLEIGWFDHATATSYVRVSGIVWVPLHTILNRGH
jgi:hypothetical protein